MGFVVSREDGKHVSCDNWSKASRADAADHVGGPGRDSDWGRLSRAPAAGHTRGIAPDVVNLGGKCRLVWHRER
jgi:hypothetical protein